MLLQLIPRLKERGLRLAVIKHSHHDFEIDQPGKDSYELHHAGSSQTLLTSRFRSALIEENTPPAEPLLAEQVNKLNLAELDLVLVEGFRHERALSRIELHRPNLGKPLLFPQEPNIIALACDQEIDCDIPRLDLNQADQIVEFMIHWMESTPPHLPA